MNSVLELLDQNQSLLKSIWHFEVLARQFFPLLHHTRQESGAQQKTSFQVIHSEG